MLLLGVGGGHEELVVADRRDYQPALLLVRPVLALSPPVTPTHRLDSHQNIKFSQNVQQWTKFRLSSRVPESHVNAVAAVTGELQAAAGCHGQAGAVGLLQAADLHQD